MITVTTCPTITLEKLVREFERPKSFTESVILRGAQAEIQSRAEVLPNSEAENLRKEVDEMNAELATLEDENERLAEKIKELESVPTLGGVEKIVESLIA
jgi:predicted  nucleic acid-binding Zn-ribbon protein